MSNEIKPYSPGQEKFGTALIKFFGNLQVFVYRLTGGRLMNKFLGAPVAILTHQGKKTGKWRHTPLLFLETGENVVLAASKGGMSKHPMWKYNLDANPECEIQIGANRRPMTARVATQEEEDEFWPQLTAIYADFEEYRSRVAGVRHISLYVLQPKTS
jgi:deazaflavin-dependent oxidoreductase (nitroreductase family)